MRPSQLRLLPLRQYKKDSHALARPLLASDMIKGPKGSPFEGGMYHGKLRFPPEYPFKPPAIYMLTPNGRFKPNTKLCLSMSDFHPETWNPLWSVSSVITGLYTFWLDTAPTVGSTTATLAQKRAMARDSWAFNARDPLIRKMFPELLESPDPLPELPVASEAGAKGARGGGGGGGEGGEAGGGGWGLGTVRLLTAHHPVRLLTTARCFCSCFCYCRRAWARQPSFCCSWTRRSRRKHRQGRDN